MVHGHCFGNANCRTRHFVPKKEKQPLPQLIHSTDISKVREGLVTFLKLVRWLHGDAITHKRSADYTHVHAVFWREIFPLDGAQRRVIG